MAFGSNLRVGWYEGYGGNPDYFYTQQLLFNGLNKHFELHPSYTKVACFYGSGANSFVAGPGAFSVFRATEATVPYDIAICLAAGSSWLSGTFDGITDGLGVQISYHSSSQSWSGGTANNGTDYFITNSVEPWKSASLVLPYTNAAGGTYATSRTGVQTLTGAGGYTNTRSMLFASDDEGTFVAVIDGAANDHVREMTYFGCYQTNSGSGITVPLCIADLPSVAASVAILNGPNGPGVTAGVLTTQPIAAGGGSGRDQFYSEESRYQFPDHPVLVLMNDGGTNKYVCGTIPMITAVPYSAAQMHLYNSGSRMALSMGSGGGANLYCYSVPWASGTTPRITR